MSERFIAYVALAKPAALTAAMVIDRVGLSFAGVPIAMSAAGSGPALPGEAMLVTIEGKPYTVISVEQPLPRDAWHSAVELDRVWPEASEAMAQQRAHLIVASLTAPASHGDAMEMAAAISMITAAIVSLSDALAVIWSNGDVISEARTFQMQALGLANRQLPIDRWIGFTWLDGPPTDKGERTLACLTTGLRPFVGRELEFLPAPLPPVTIAQRLIGTCQYLIANGLVLGDGETLGISQSERIRVRHAAQGQRPGVPVLKLSVEMLDQPPAPPPSGPVSGLGAAKPVTGAPQGKPVFGRRGLS
jgi:hypothetical protein